MKNKSLLLILLVASLMTINVRASSTVPPKFKIDQQLINFYDRNKPIEVKRLLAKLNKDLNYESFYDAYATYDIWKHSDGKWQSTGSPGEDKGFIQYVKIPYMYDCLVPYDFKATYNPSFFEGWDKIYKARVSGFLNGTGNELNSDQIQYKNGQLEITEKIKLEGMETPEGNDIKEGWQASTVEGWRFYVPFRISWKYRLQIPNDLAVENLKVNKTTYKPGDKLVFDWDYTNHGQWGIIDSNPEVMAQVFINGQQVNAWKIENLAGRERILKDNGETGWSEPVREHFSYGYDVPTTGAPDEINFEVRINVPYGEMKESTDYNNTAKLKVIGIHKSILKPDPFIEHHREPLYLGNSYPVNGWVKNPNKFPVICEYVLTIDKQSTIKGSAVIPAQKDISMGGLWTPEDLQTGTFTLKATIWETVPAPTPGMDAGYVYHKGAKAWYIEGSPKASATTVAYKSSILPEEEPIENGLMPSIIVD